MPKEGFHCSSLSVIMNDSVFKNGKNWYPQMFSEECQYIEKEKKISRYISNGLYFLFYFLFLFFFLFFFFFDDSNKEEDSNNDDDLNRRDIPLLFYKRN